MTVTCTEEQIEKRIWKVVYRDGYERAVVYVTTPPNMQERTFPVLTQCWWPHENQAPEANVWEMDTSLIKSVTRLPGTLVSVYKP